MNLARVRLLVWKEFRQLRRDTMLLRILILMPVLQLVFMGYVVGADVTRLPTAVVDLDRTPVSRQLTAAFAGSDYFDVRERPDGETALQPLMDTGRVRVAVVVPAGTQAALERGEVAPLGIVVDGSDSNSSSVGSGYAMQIVARFNAERAAAAAGAAGPGHAGGASSSAVVAASGVPGLDARVRVLYNPTLSTVNAMVPGLIAFILMLSLMVVMSQAVVKERESGVLEQMFVTPIRPSEYLVGKVVPYALLALVQTVLVGVVGMAWFRVPMHGSLLVVGAGLTLFMFSAMGLGLLVSLLARTRQQAQQTVLFLMLPMMLLSGFVFPVDSMPEPVKPLTYLIPLRWVLEVIRPAIMKGAGFDALGLPLLVLAGFGIVIFGAAVIASHRRIGD